METIIKPVLGVLMDTFLWILEDVLLISGVVFLVLGMLWLISWNPKGFLFMLTGTVCLLIFWLLFDPGSINEIYERGLNLGRR
jgi:hypothetical protein